MVKLKPLKNEDTTANVNHTNKDINSAFQKLLFANFRYVMKKNTYIPALNGTIMLASLAASIPCINPIKRSPTTAVDGNPVINPPSLPPTFSAIVVETTTHEEPITKESNHLTMKSLSISGVYQTELKVS